MTACAGRQPGTPALGPCCHDARELPVVVLHVVMSISIAEQARRESNPQPPVLETGALPIELLT